jgi:hypothetical protein
MLGGITRMEQSKRDFRWLKVTGALLLGFLLLAALLPSTGGIIAGPPPNPKMWRCGPFLFFPSGFFGVVGIMSFVTGCTVFGIVRHNACELIGWVLYGVVVFLMILT